MRAKVRAVLIGATASAALATAGPAFGATTYCVHQTGTCAAGEVDEGPNLQQALTDAAAGDSTVLVPIRVTRQFVCAWVVRPVNVPSLQSLQPRSRVPARRHIWVGILSPVGVASAALIVPAPSLVKVMIRCRLSALPLAASLSPTNVNVAVGIGVGVGLGDAVGVGVGVGLGVGLGDGLAEAAGDAEGDGETAANDGDRDGPPGPPRTRSRTKIAPTTTTRAVPRTPMTRRRVWSLMPAS
jgi:hypothetical protein